MRTHKRDIELKVGEASWEKVKRNGQRKKEWGDCSRRGEQRGDVMGEEVGGGSCVWECKN